MGSAGFADSLRLWVKEIIIVLLLGGLVEMILPETETKRFARVALGFFVILAVGRPVLSALGGGFILDRELAGLGSWELGVAPGGSGGLAGGFEGPLERGFEMRNLSRDRVLAATRAALETQLAALAERDPDVAAAAAEVDLATDPSSPGYGSITAVRLTVWLSGATVDGGEGGTPSAPAGDAGSGEVVDPVAPVTVTVEPIVTGGREGRPADQGAAGSAGGSADPRGERVASRLKSQLVLLVGVPPGRSEERRVGKECRSRWSPYH